MSKERVVDLFTIDFQETTTVGSKIYSTMDLWSRAEEEEELTVPLACIELAMKPWESIENIYQFANHYARCEDADMSKPILLDPMGGIINGWHRICKAIIQGDKYIKAKQLKRFPEPITINK